MKAMKTTMSIGTYGKLTWQCNKPTIQTSIDPIKTSIDAIKTSIYRVFPRFIRGFSSQDPREAGRTLPASHPTERRMAWSDSSPGWFRPGKPPGTAGEVATTRATEVGTKMDIS
jgi:hypothetical protein